MIEKFETYITPFKLNRKVHVYLPDDYYNSDERYPVVYMYDGHNLFFDSDATYGKSWGLKDFLDSYDKKLIIVGVECSNEGKRLDEYCPYTLKGSYLGDINGRGMEYMDWLTYEFKPMIDQKYRTIPFRECTAIAGSSMGGLMSLYTILQYNTYYSKAACVSPSYALCMPQLEKLSKEVKINPDTRVYMSFGTNEMRNKEFTYRTLKQWVEYFESKKAYTHVNVVEGGYHNEASWERENPVYMDFLWK